MAIILILVIAGMLIFFAVSVNIGQISHVKTMATIASNVSAGQLASAMASYAENLSQTNLGGQRKVCASTGVLGALLSIIIIVIVMVFNPPGGAALALSLFGLALAVVSLAMQIMVIQPGITEAWNRIITKTLSLGNQITEGAIQSALMRAVEDREMIPDITDSDGDRQWVSYTAGTEPSPPFDDMVNRFSVYYGQRLLHIKGVDTTLVRNFANALSDFLIKDSDVDDWGIHDPIASCWGVAECNECCVPSGKLAMTETGDCVRDDVGNCVVYPIRPEKCDDPASPFYNANWVAYCGSTSTYGPSYPWVYDPQLENSQNTYYSFRELLGIDDEHRDFYKPVPVFPTWDPYQRPQTAHIAGDQNFYLEDATNFYIPPVYAPSNPTPAPPESRKGVFPFFHKIRDWGVPLRSDDGGVGTYNFMTKPRECHWCDEREWDCPNCSTIMEGPHAQPLEIPQLVLPEDPAGLIYNRTHYVDGVNSSGTPPIPPLSVDKVTLPGNILAETNQCAQKTFYPVENTSQGFWKEGGDRYCSGPEVGDPNNPNPPPVGTVWPYHNTCLKFTVGCVDPAGCECSAANATYFPDDPLDDIIYGLGDFIAYAKDFIKQASPDTIQQFVMEFPRWYPDLARWIEPSSPPATPSLSADQKCFDCDLTDGVGLPKDGTLWIWLTEMKGIASRLKAWVETSYAGANCAEVWCVPPSSPTSVPADYTCRYVPQDEIATFDTNFNGTPGEMEDIVGCLNYNVEGYDHVAAEKFRSGGCLNNCDGGNCIVGVDLPEYHLDGITPYNYPVDPNPGVGLSCSPGTQQAEWREDIQLNLAQAVKPIGTREGNDVRFARCGQTCGLADCFSLPGSILPYNYAIVYRPQDYATTFPSLADEWIKIRALNDCLTKCDNENCKVGPRLPPDPPGPSIDYPATPFNESADCASVGGNLNPSSPWYTAIINYRNSLTPRDEVDIAKFLRCFDSCNVADCQAMPTVHTSNGTAYTWTSSPATFTAANCAPWNGTNIWYNEIVANLKSAGGNVCDPSPNGWLAKTRQSAVESRNQVVKFAHRRDFLDGRLQEIISEEAGKRGVLPILEEAIREFGLFLGDPALLPAIAPSVSPSQGIIAARIAFNPNEEFGLPYHAVYGWQDDPRDPPPGQRRGKWHVVKVEARIPGNCDNACNVSGVGDPEWPRIITYTKNWGTTRCYELINTEGIVKFRVTRYDEQMASGLLAFPNGVPIWNPRTAHPDRSMDPPDMRADIFDAEPLVGECATSAVNVFPDFVTPTPDSYKGAFIMEKLIESGTDQNRHCWYRAHNLLSRGVTSETCARYTWDDAAGRMNFRFISCQGIPF